MRAYFGSITRTLQRYVERQAFDLVVKMLVTSPEPDIRVPGSDTHFWLLTLASWNADCGRQQVTAQVVRSRCPCGTHRLSSGFKLHHSPSQRCGHRESKPGSGATPASVELPLYIEIPPLNVVWQQESIVTDYSMWKACLIINLDFFFSFRRATLTYIQSTDLMHFMHAVLNPKWCFSLSRLDGARETPKGTSVSSKTQPQCKWYCLACSYRCLGHTAEWTNSFCLNILL